MRNGMSSSLPQSQRLTVRLVDRVMLLVWLLRLAQVSTAHFSVLSCPWFELMT